MVEKNHVTPWVLESFPSLGLALKVPHPDWVKNQYEKAKDHGEEIEFPFWTRIWPASVALSEYISENLPMFHRQKVLELGAGIGLPSFVAATQADHVIVTDFLPEIRSWLDMNIQFMGRKNMESLIVDWTKIPPDISADIILMSDLNYAPEQFSGLHEQINRFMESGSTVLLSSPHRLAGRTFLSEWINSGRHRETREIQMKTNIQSIDEKITILLLKK